MTQALTVRNEMSIGDMMTLGEMFANSGFFSDAKQAAQAVVKIQAGRELGIGPAASMTAIHIVQNKPTLSANVIAAKVKGSGKYDYRIAQNKDDACEIVFFQGSEELGRSTFTIADATRAGLMSNPTWKKYPRNMLFSRAMSNGARWYCPDAFSGITIYTPEEMGAEVDGETGDVIDVTPVIVETPEPPPAPKPQPRQKAAKPDKATNGDKAPRPPADSKGEATSPNDLLAQVNQQTSGAYNHLRHLLNGIKLELGEDWSWPGPYDKEAWDEAERVAVSHATKQVGELQY